MAILTGKPVNLFNTFQSFTCDPLTPPPAAPAIPGLICPRLPHTHIHTHLRIPKAPHCPHISGRIVFFLQNTKLTSTKADENGHMTFRQKLRSRAYARVRYTQPGNARPTREYFNTYGAQKHKAILSILTGHKHRAILQYYCQYLRGNPSILNTNTYGGANQYFAGSLRCRNTLTTRR